MKKFKSKIKDILLINKVRLENFIKEHKYVSSFIGLFLVAGIISFIVFAASDPLDSHISSSVGNVAVRNALVTSNNNITTIPSFNTITYDIPYTLSVGSEITTNDKTSLRDVTIVATYDGNYDLNWIQGDENASYTIDKSSNKVTVVINNININETHHQKLYLRVGNVANGTNVNISVKVYESTSSENYTTTPAIPSVSVTSREVALTAKIVSGNPYKDSSYSDGRYAPFGILLGIDSETLQNNNNSLSGLYFNPDQSITLEALQSSTNLTESQISLLTSEGNYGLYDTSKNLLSTPNYKFNNSNNSVYDSGSVTNFKVSEAGVSGTSITSTSPTAYLIGDKSVEVTKNGTYVEQGIKTSTSGSAMCLSSSTACTRIIKKGTTTVTDAEMVQTAGNYVITYTLSGENNNNVTLIRNVEVKDNQQSITVDNNVYKLLGNTVTKIVKGSSYTDDSISKNDTKVSTSLSELSIKIKQGSSETTINNPTLISSNIDTSLTGNVTITYTITSTDNSTSQSLTRTLNIIDSLETTSAPVISADNIVTSSSTQLTDLPITLNGSSIICNSSNSCQVKYYDKTSNEVSTIDTSKASTYTVQYKYTDTNGFIATVYNTLTVQIKYDLTIKGIKTDGTFYMYDNIAALGSYFVIAKTERPTGNQDEINVTLKLSNGSVSSTSIDNYQNKGTKTSSLSFNTETAGELTELKIIDSNNYDSVTYGDSVILRSQFNYSKDGDSNLSTLTTTIPINGITTTSSSPTAPFTLTDYSSQLTENPYYVNGIDSSKLTVKYLACDMAENSTLCSNSVTTYDSYSAFKDAVSSDSNLKLAYIRYIATDVKPGTVIDFRVKLIINVGNQKGNISTSSTSQYTSDIESSSALSNVAVINITAFKARSKILINDKNADTIIDSTNVSTSTLTIQPSVSLPAELVTTNIAGISTLDYVKVIVTLPSGMNYTYNDDYIQPSSITTSSGSQILTYILKNQSVNTWIDPIKLDVSYDISIQNNTKLQVTSLIDASANGSITDTSSASSRTSVRNITYQNNEIISYGQYTPYSAISKNTSFDVITKLYSTESQSNLSLITLLPYNDVSNETALYNGEYTISNLQSGTLCTTSLPSLILNTSNLVLTNEVEWRDCSNYSSTNYSGVTALKLPNISLSQNNLYQNKITINPSNNKSGDKYEIRSYLVTGSTVEDVKSIKLTSVSVVSKRISGTVWEDFDANGIMNSDENKISDVVMKLYDSKSNELIQTVSTDKKGKYEFSDLIPGTYYIVPEYNTAKYTYSPYTENPIDKSVVSSYKQIATESESSGEESTSTTTSFILKSNDITVTNNTRTITNINLGLALRKIYTVKLNKYISKAIVTNKFGITTTNDYGNVSLAKLNVRDMNSLSIKVIYTLELENTGYYPGYIYSVKDYIPDGMSFNSNYEENAGWKLTESGYLENTSLYDKLISGGEKKYLTLALDISRKEAGSFVNNASVTDDDLQILVVAGSEGGEE